MDNHNTSRRNFLRVSGASVIAGSAVGLAPDAVLAGPFDHLPALYPPKSRENLGGQPLPPLAFRVYHKLAFGPRAGDIAAFNAMGANDDTRLANWLEQQLFPTNSDPEVESRINGNPNFITLNKSLAQLWTDNVRYDGPMEYLVDQRPVYETEGLTLTRMLHSQWQLREVLADFWHNHFNVDGYEDTVRGLMTYYDRDIIRPFIFGNFRQMLEANAKSTSMLYYLDNRVNSTPNPNENYARELLELHTLGAVENYFGFVPTSEVPMNVDGVPKGYVEADVLELARLLTGFGVADGNDGAPDTGAFLFRANRHDNGSKTVVGLTVPGTGESELDVILDYLASHRGTAEFICWKLAVRFIGDSFTASDPLVQAAADIFQNNWQANNQLELVYRELFLSNEFKTRWGDKAKRPVEMIIAAMRAAGSTMTIQPFQRTDTPAAANRDGVLNGFNQAGQAVFDYEPPTGFPEDKPIWQGTGPLIMSWRAITSMLRERDDNGDLYANVAITTNTSLPGAARTPNNIVDFWLNVILGFPISSAKRAPMVAFVAQGGGVDDPLNTDTTNTAHNSNYQRRVRGLVELITMMPEYMTR
ncbi:MAG: DUF1800 domain-containing protein [Wenzhouxiangellaceae bacterium]